jgi:hypothetical protein
MFEVGDKVICIEQSKVKNFEVEFNKIFTVIKCDKHIILIDNNTNMGYFSRRFILFEKYRRDKILKIKEKICNENRSRKNR